MTENKRIKILLDDLGLTQKELADKLSMQQGSLSDVIRGKNNVKVSESIKFKLENLYSVNRKWLETGEGVMYNKSNPRLEADPQRLASDPDDLIGHGDKFIELPDGTMEMIVPVVPHKAQAGYLRGFQDPEYYEDFQTVTVRVNKRYRGTYIGFEVVGDSMVTTDPALFYMMALPGWTAIGRELPRHHFANKLHIHRVVNWIIVHKTEGILIKNITKHDVENGVITIHSLNPKYPDEELLLDDVAQLFSVVKFEVDR